MRRLRHDAALAKNVHDGVVGIGWPEVEDLNAFTTRDEYKMILAELHSDDSPQRIATHAGVLYRYTHSIKTGDRVLVPMKSSDVIKIGAFTEDRPYRVEDFDDRYVHCRKVNWLQDISREDLTQDARYSVGSALTLSQPSQVVVEQVEALLQGRSIVEDDEEIEPQDTEDVILDEVLTERRAEFIAEALERRKGYDYQRVIAGLLQAMGYHVVLGPRGRDQKRDIIAHPDKLGLQDPVIRVEVKSGNSAAGVEEIRALMGALMGHERGLFVSRMGFTHDATAFANTRANLSMLDGEQVTDLILEHYDRLPSYIRDWVPLKRVWIPDV